MYLESWNFKGLNPEFIVFKQTCLTMKGGDYYIHLFKITIPKKVGEISEGGMPISKMFVKLKTRFNQS